MHTMIDLLGYVGAALDEVRPAALARLCEALDLGVRYEPEERAAYITARPRDSTCVRGDSKPTCPKGKIGPISAGGRADNAHYDRPA